MVVNSSGRRGGRRCSAAVAERVGWTLSCGRENLAENVSGSLTIMTFGLEHMLEMILSQPERFGWEPCVLHGILPS